MIPATASLWMVLPVILPLAASIGCFLFRRGAYLISLIAASGILLAAGILVGQFLLEGARTYGMGGWDVPLGIGLRIDGPTVLMLAMAGICGTGITLYARGYFSFRAASARAGRHSRQEAYFWPLWLMLWAGLNGMFLSADVFNIYVTLEIVGVSAAALAALSGKHASQIASFRYLLVSLLGSLSYLLGVAFLYRIHGVLDMGMLKALASDTAGMRAALALMTLGLLLKTAVFPLHFWLPPAHSNALSPVSAILSGLVVKGSFYLLFRFWFDLFPAVISEPALNLMGILGACAVFWGAVQALQQQRLKLLVAYSTVSQIGYLFIAFPLAQAQSGVPVWGAVIFMAISHAFAKSAMFMAAGTIFLLAGHDRIKDLAGIRVYLPVTVFAYATAGVNLMGLPPSGGFIAKWLMVTSALESSQWWWGLAVIAGSMLAIAYVFKVVSRLFVTPEEYTVINTHGASGFLEWPALILALLSLLMGLLASWPLDILSRAEMIARVVLPGGGA